MMDKAKEEWQRLHAAQMRFDRVRTEDQLSELIDIALSRQITWAIDSWFQDEPILLRAINNRGQCVMSIPFDENSTSEDVQKFIDLLKVADVHES